MNNSPLSGRRRLVPGLMPWGARRRRASPLRSRVLGFIPILLVVVTAHATDRTWIGGSGDWTTSTNWNPNANPTGADNLTINNGTASVSSSSAQGGVVSVGGVSSQTGAIDLSTGGTLTVNRVLRFSGGNANINFNGGTMVFTAFSNTDVVSNFGAGEITLNSLGGALHTNGSDYTFSSPIGGTGSLTKLGNGILFLGGANTYSGDTIITQGSVWLIFGSNRLSSATDLVFNPAAPASSPAPTPGFNLNNFDQTVASVTFGASSVAPNASAAPQPIITTGSGKLTVNGNVTYDATNHPGSATINGKLDLGTANRTFDTGDSMWTNAELQVNAVISGSAGVGIVKSGAGTLVLAGANSYNGSTSVNAGVLQVDGSIASSAVTVNGGTLKGVGTVGALAVNSGGTLAPGDSPGILHVNGNLQLTMGSTYLVEINGTAVGTQYDQTDVMGLVSLGNATLSLNLGFTPTIGNSFIILNNDSIDAISGTFNNLAEGAKFSSGGSAFEITYLGGSGNDVVLTSISEVPEPATWGAACLVVGSLLGFHVYRRRTGLHRSIKAPSAV